MQTRQSGGHERQEGGSAPYMPDGTPTRTALSQPWRAGGPLTIGRA